MTASLRLWAEIVLVLLLLLQTVCHGGCKSLNRRPHHHQHNKHVAALFVFGDSLFDPGNNNYINTTTDFQANFFPYGESFFSTPTGRFSDGRLLSDFIAEFAKLPLIPAYLQPVGDHDFAYGANFASGGAGALVETHSGNVVTLKTQLKYFKDLKNQLTHKLGDYETKQMLSNAVYLFSCGGNDYLNPLRTYTEEQFVELVIGNLTEVIKEIYKMSGTKFAFVTLPPLGCLPSNRVKQPGNKCVEELTALAKLHNQALSKELKKLEMLLKGFMHSKFDLFTSLMRRLENPTKYGFKEADMACCGSGPLRGLYSCGGKRGIKEYQLCENASEHFFFDSNHPNEVASQQFAELFWHGSPNVTEPYNLKSLFEGPNDHKGYVL